MHFDPSLQRQLRSLGFEGSIIGRDICATLLQHPQTKANALMVTGHTMVMMMSRVTTMTEMRMIWRGEVDHPDEGGGSELCEIGWNEQGEGQLIFLNSI